MELARYNQSVALESDGVLISPYAVFKHCNPKDVVANLDNNTNWSTPEKMVQSFLDYLNFIENNNIIKTEFHAFRAGIAECHPHTMVAGSLSAFCSFAYSTTIEFYNKSRNLEFTKVCAWIKETIAGRNIMGAAGFQLSSALIIRLEGLADKKEVTNHEIKTVTFAVPEGAYDEVEVEADFEDLD